MKRLKNITLIWPNLGRLMKDGKDAHFSDKASMEPLPLAALAALIPEEIEVNLIDDRFEEIPYDQPTDLVCISIEIFTARRGYEIADAFRNRGVKVVLGGIHPSLMPNEAKYHADTVVVGDAENCWQTLMDDFNNDCLQPFYYAEIAIQPQGHFPRRELFKKHEYLPIMLLQFGRGCPYACSFCAIAACFKQHHLTRPVNDVVDEICKDGRRLLFFVDDNIIANPTAAKELFKALIPLKIKWMGQASIDMAADDELLDLMARSGCIGHVIGFETIRATGLKHLNKQVNLVNYDRYHSAIQNLTRYGIQIWAAFVIGHDEDTPDTVKETLSFARFYKFAFGAFNILMPYPQTPFYENLKNDNRLLYNNNWWLHPDYLFNHSAFIPKNFTPQELTDVCRDLKTQFNSFPDITRRVIKAVSMRKSFNSGLFLLKYSMLFRTESFKKNYLKLGNRL